MKRVLVTFFSLSLLWMPQSFAKEAKAVLQDTTDATKSYGEIIFTDSPEGLKVEGKFANVPAGKHGFHIHEYGSCDDKGNAAGGHYNPRKVDHGLLSKDGKEHAHLGDMGNVEIAADGTGKISTVLAGVTLSGGDHNVEGRALVLHEKTDDFGQPTGNAGGRIGCGLIAFPAPAPAPTPAVAAPADETPAPVTTETPSPVVVTPTSTPQPDAAQEPVKDDSGTATVK